MYEDDTDMLMQPDEIHGRVQDQYFTPIKYHQEYVNLERSTQAYPNSEHFQTPAAQNFLPSFFRNVPPLGHSRPYINVPEQQPPLNTQSRFSSARSIDQSILGSGDFGVIRGGTFYQENDPPARATTHALDNDYLSFYNNNGHGRPHTAPYTKNYYPEEQFANFRDFADINTPTDPAFSQFVVVYANKNATSATHPNPKNIFEQLQIIESDNHQRKSVTSKFKKKLSRTKLEKKFKKVLGPKESNGESEPLLALS